MTTRPVDSQRPTVVVAPVRNRETERPAAPFREALAGGLNVLLAGAETAGGVIGGPVLAAAVRQARESATASVSGRPAGEATPTPTDGGLPAGMSDIAALQRESQVTNMQLLALQEEIQQENRRFSTLTNVLRARHDTAKAAVSNIRS